MNPVDPIATTRSHDAGLNAAREIMPDADPNLIATNAMLMNRGLLTAEQLRDAVMRARALPK